MRLIYLKSVKVKNSKPWKLKNRTLKSYKPARLQLKSLIWESWNVPSSIPVRDIIYSWKIGIKFKFFVLTKLAYLTSLKLTEAESSVTILV